MNTRIIRFLFGMTIALAIALLLVLLPTRTVIRAEAPLPLSGVDIHVDTTADQYSGTGCSLRDAIQTANTGLLHGDCTQMYNLSTTTTKFSSPRALTR